MRKSCVRLRQALDAVIQDHTVILWESTVNPDSVDALKVLDEDPADTNNVILVYSGWSVPKADYGEDGWNREHLWPISYGFGTGTTSPSYRDLFSLRACDALVNSSRGNKLYDFSDPTDRNYRASAHTNAPECSSDTDSWEPPDSMKGDIARVMFYMDLRYASPTSVATNETDLVLTDNLGSVVSGNPFMGRLSSLLRWHQSDPVDSAEHRRNDLIYARYQHNRNPFVDHPEWVGFIYLPKLEIASRQNGFAVSWETNWTSAVFESALEPDGPWSSFPIEPTIDGNRLVVFGVASTSRRLFRLRIW